MTLTQILQKIKSAFYTKSETESKLSTKANSSDLNNYFPKLGGTLTGGVVQRDVNNDTLDIQGAYGGENGARVLLVGKDYPDADLSGNFFIDAQNGTNMVRLRGTPSGSLIWNGKQVAVAGDYLPRSGGIMTSYNVMGRNVTNSHLQIAGGTYDGDGAFLSLAGKDFSPRPGAFFMVARTADKVSYLQGNPNGSLIWNEKDIDVIDSQGDGYIRYSNGLQICWGTGSWTTATATITYPKTFINDDVFPIACYGSDYNSEHYMSVINGLSSKTSFIVKRIGDEGAWRVNWQAIGKWK